MKTMRILAVMLLIAVVVAAPFALGQTGKDDNHAARIAASFVRLAGSEENALALVNALHSGDRVTLVSDAGGARTPLTTSFELPTGPMDWDNVMIALALARDSLTRAGVLHPTPEELEAALLGGDISTAKGRIRLGGALYK